MNTDKIQDFTDINARLEKAAPQEVLRWAYETYGTGLVIVTSFQVTGVVTLHMLQEIAPDVEVLTLDTGLLFPETYALIEQIEERLGITVQRIHPEHTVQEQAAAYGDKLWERDPTQCCHMRKVLPLQRALSGYDAWLTGLRRDQSPRRANTPIVSWDAKHEMVKIAPFATWTEEMIWIYASTYELPFNALYDQGYTSIGCVPCTQIPADSDPRSGRWAGQNKTECGIHTDEQT